MSPAPMALVKAILRLYDHNIWPQSNQYTQSSLWIKSLGPSTLSYGLRGWDSFSFVKTVELGWFLSCESRADQYHINWSLNSLCKPPRGIFFKHTVWGVALNATAAKNKSWDGTIYILHGTVFHGFVFFIRSKCKWRAVLTKRKNKSERVTFRVSRGQKCPTHPPYTVSILVSD